MNHLQQLCLPLLSITIAAVSKTIFCTTILAPVRLLFIKPTLTERLPKFIPKSVLPLGLGLAVMDLTNPNDRVIAFDFLGNGKLDHLLCYRPNTGDVNPGLVSILQKNSDGTFKAVFTSNQGIGKYNLHNPIDRIVAFDYLNSGNLDHLVCYRSHEGICWIRKTTMAIFRQSTRTMVRELEVTLFCVTPTTKILSFPMIILAMVTWIISCATVQVWGQFTSLRMTTARLSLRPFSKVMGVAGLARLT